MSPNEPLDMNEMKTPNEPPSPPRRTHPFQEVRDSLITDGRFALRKGIEKLFRAGLTHAEVSREIQAVIDDSGVLS